MHVPATILFAATVFAVTGAASSRAEDIRQIARPWVQFREDSSLRFYGSANLGSLSFDDGGDTTNYGITANGNSASRIGIAITSEYPSGWSFFANAEMGFLIRPARERTQLGSDEADDGSDRTELRKLEVSIANPRGGRFWVGQGGMASDGSAEHDLSGTVMVAGANVANLGGGLFRRTDGRLSDVTTAAAFNNFDGLGRHARLRYDTAEIAGFTFAASYGKDVVNDRAGDQRDIAVTYRGKWGGRDVVAGLALANDLAREAESLSGSASLRDPDSGLSLTIAAARRQTDLDSRYGYVKLGWKGDLIGPGSSAISIDHYHGTDIAISGSDSRSWGLAVVQHVDQWNTAFYLGLRRYDYDDNAGDYRRGLATMIGMDIDF
jgi:hypothetical protein